MQTRPDTGNDIERYVLPESIITDALLFTGDMNNGDQLSHLLSSGDAPHDLSLGSGDSVGFHLTLRLFSLTPGCNFGGSCYADTELPAGGSNSVYGCITTALGPSRYTSTSGSI